MENLNPETLTPKQMAVNLIQKFYDINDDSKSNLGGRPYISRAYARDCAKIYTNGMINETRKAYWYEVAKELENE
jgi:hypothetical protein